MSNLPMAKARLHLNYNELVKSWQTMLYIIDDDVDFTSMIEQLPIVEEIGFKVFNLPSQFLTNVTLANDDIVMLDINMPEYDGVEVLRRLASEAHFANIVLMSGMDYSVLKSMELLAKELGFNVLANFTKPFKLKELANTIAKCVIDQQTQPLKLVEHGDSLSHNFSKAELLSGFENNEFVLFYQPQIDIKTKKLVSVEGLVRWCHPQYGVLPPNKFLSQIERFDLFKQLNDCIIQCFITSESHWQSLGINLQVSININASSVIDLTLPEKLVHLVNNAAIAPDKLCLEITESELMSDLITSLDTLTRLRVKGFRLSIDDFGTGFSSLVQLQRIPFTELKIDRAFVSTLLENKESMVIVEACIFLAKKLAISVVAEGVEDERTILLLEQLGCDIAQGYYISKPLSEAELIEWIQHQ